MKNRPLIIGVAVLAAVSLWVLLEPSGAMLGRLMGEPFLDGKPLRYWKAAVNGSPAENAEALETFARAEKSDAEPMLIALYRNGPSEAEQRWTALDLLAEHAPLSAEGQNLFLAALDDPDEHVRSVAIASVAESGISADQALPVLVEKLNGPHAVIAAREISEYRGSAAAALPQLIELMQSNDASVEARWNAVRTIGKIGPDAISAVPQLIDELDNPEDTIREHAAEAIGDIGPTAAELGVPALRGVLGDPYVKVRRDAVRSLGYIGPTAVDAVDDIIPLLDDPEEMVQTATRDALQKIAPDRIPTE